VEVNPAMAVTFLVDGSMSASLPVLPAGTRIRFTSGAYWRSSYPTPASPPGMAIASGGAPRAAADEPHKHKRMTALTLVTSRMMDPPVIERLLLEWRPF